MKGKRTGIDFSKHQHRIEHYNCAEKEIQIDHFQVGDSNTNYIQFINTDRTLTVTGDFGNWVFCRPFYPNAKEGVSDGYWLEKLHILSCQNPYEYNGDDTAKEIQELIDKGLEEYGFEGDELQIIKEWYSDLLEYTEEEHDYVYHAHYNYGRPGNIDHESIPYCKDLKNWLNVIFDAFDEICRRMKES